VIDEQFCPVSSLTATISSASATEAATSFSHQTTSGSAGRAGCVDDVVVVEEEGYRRRTSRSSDASIASWPTY